MSFGKNSLMSVHEWLQRKPEYEREDETRNIGSFMAPQFMVTLKLFPKDSASGLPTYMTTGVGRKIKDAKTDAADKIVPFLGIYATPEDARAVIPQQSSSQAGAAGGWYPPGVVLDTHECLQRATLARSEAFKELCANMEVGEPEYLFDSHGPPHRKIFVCNLEFEGIKRKGTALNKADAKRLARYKWLAAYYEKNSTTSREPSRTTLSPVNINEPSGSYYHHRPYCDYVGNQTNVPCFSKVEHVSHQLFLEVKGGPVLQLLLNATRESITSIFEVVPSDIEELLHAKGKNEILNFFEELMADMGMTAEICYFNKNSELIFDSTAENDNDKEEQVFYQDKNDQEERDHNDEEEAFFSCDEGSDSEDCKMTVSSVTSTNPDLSFYPAEFYLCSIQCSGTGIISGRTVSVSSLKRGSSKAEAKKAAIIDLLGQIAVLCRDY